MPSRQNLMTEKSQLWRCKRIFMKLANKVLANSAWLSCVSCLSSSPVTSAVFSPACLCCTYQIWQNYFGWINISGAAADRRKEAHNVTGRRLEEIAGCARGLQKRKKWEERKIWMATICCSTKLRPQDAWRIKVLKMSFQNFWLLFLLILIKINQWILKFESSSDIHPLPIEWSSRNQLFIHNVNYAIS